jgi:1,2-diacylglycerol 3-alpha-glucosyltransferase
MHIGYYTNAYHPTISGVVTSVSTYRQTLSDLGHNVFVFAPHAENYEDPEPFVFRYSSIDVPTFPDLPLVIPISPAIDHLMPALKLDVLHSHHPVLLGQTAAHKAEKMKLPLVFTYHTRYREYSHYISLNQKFVKEQIDHWLCEYLSRVHHIITPSESMRKILMDEYGFSTQMTTIPTGIDFSRYEKAQGEALRIKRGWGGDLVLISVGRLAPEKNWTTLIKAAASVIRKHANVRLIILGDGAERNQLEKQAHDLGIADRLELPGRIGPQDVPHYLAAADIFCFASITETQGLATLEAMAAGLPVAAVDASGTSDAVEQGKQGFLTDNNSAALAQAIEKLVVDSELRKQMSANARAKAKEYDIVHQAQRLLAVYEEAIEDAKAGRYINCKRERKLFDTKFLSLR